MKAIYSASPRSKKGNVFHVYNVVGTVAELEEYKNSPNFVKYPSVGPKGEIQFITNYIGMEDEMNMVMKKDGNFTLDTGTFNKDVARLNAVAEASAVLADKFADRLADKLSAGAKAVSKFTANVQFVEETSADESTDNLDNM
jgi:hypothetical protein